MALTFQNFKLDQPSGFLVHTFVISETVSGRKPIRGGCSNVEVVLWSEPGKCSGKEADWAFSSGASTLKGSQDCLALLDHMISAPGPPQAFFAPVPLPYSDLLFS